MIESNVATAKLSQKDDASIRSPHNFLILPEVHHRIETQALPENKYNEDGNPARSMLHMYGSTWKFCHEDLSFESAMCWTQGHSIPGFPWAPAFQHDLA